jgi:hypothetical protein
MALRIWNIIRKRAHAMCRKGRPSADAKDDADVKQDGPSNIVLQNPNEGPELDDDD